VQRSPGEFRSSSFCDAPLTFRRRTGQALARLEVSAFLTALVDRVERIELTGTPKWALNNIVSPPPPTADPSGSDGRIATTSA